MSSPLLSGLNVNGNSVSLPSGQRSYAAIDTGTTLVGGPANQIADLYSQIPGSQPATGNFQNYYTYPCDTAVNVSLSFGGSKSWSISPADFRLSKLTSDTCLGAFFELSTGSSAPSWIVGDTFLVRFHVAITPPSPGLNVCQKNVYSVFRYEPLSIGFAELSPEAISRNGNTSLPVPSATSGSIVATVSATATSVETAVTTNSAGKIGVQSGHFRFPLMKVALCALLALIL